MISPVSRALAASSALFALVVALPAVAVAGGVPKVGWSTDGQVYSLAHDPANHTVFMGGSFTKVFHPVGAAAVVSATTGALPTEFDAVLTNFSFNAAAPDGSGGYFVGAGGGWKHKGQDMGRLVHVKADLTVDMAWPVTMTAGTIEILHYSNGTLYIGGSSGMTIGGQTRNGLASIDVATRTLTSWNPNVNGTVKRFAEGNGLLYAGGTFSQVGGTTRGQLAAFDLATGALSPFNANLTGSAVYDMAVSGSTLYIGGIMTKAGAANRVNVAAVSATTGAVLPWQITGAGANNAVNGIAVHGDNVYVGGNFTSIGGQTRKYFAVASATTGAIGAWDPAPSSVINDMTMVGDRVYVAGVFATFDGEARKGVAAIDATSNSVEAWDPRTDGGFSTITADADKVYLVGSMSGVNSLPRTNAAAFSSDTGEMLPWDPSPNSLVTTMARDGSTIYMGGAFTQLGATTRHRAAAVDTTAGTPTAWDPDADGTVNALAVGNGHVYLGGDFANLGPTGSQTARTGLAEVDTTNGAATAWAPTLTDAASPRVTALAMRGTDVYVGGQFTAVDATTRNNAAALDSTGTLTSWDPNATYVSTPSVRALAFTEDGNTVIMGGQFNAVGGQTRNGLAAVDAASGALTSWDPKGAATGSVDAISVTGQTVTFGGGFVNLGSPFHHYVASADATTGALNAWDPKSNNNVQALLSSGGVLHIGGRFTSFNSNSIVKGYGAIPDPGWPKTTVTNPALSGKTEPGATLSIDATWDPAPAYVVYSWQRCDANGANCTTITGATNSTYTLTQGDVGSTVRGVATVSAWADGRDPSTVTSALSALIAVPVADNPGTTPGTTLGTGGGGSGTGGGTPGAGAQAPSAKEKITPFVKQASKIRVSRKGLVTVKLTLLKPGRFTLAMVNAKNRRITMRKGSVIAGRKLRRNGSAPTVVAAKLRTITLKVRTKGIPKGARLRVIYKAPDATPLKRKTFRMPARRVGTPMGRLVQLAPVRSGGTLTLRWKAVRNAVRYQLIVRLPNGKGTRITTRATHATFSVGASAAGPARGTIRATNATGRTKWYALRR